MHAKPFRVSALLAAAALGGCAPTFATAMTPSGMPCSDMTIVPAGQTVPNEVHRLGPVASNPRATTEAERLESLRMEACKRGADAVIEAANEEARGPDGTYITRASGTAVVWIHHATKGPIGSAPVAAPAPAAPAPAASTPAPAPTAAAAPPAETTPAHK
jgi:hypothetical protein